MQSPSPPPLGSPTTPTLAPTTSDTETLQVFNAFEVSNSEGFTATALLSGPDKDGLNKAYVAFVSEIVANLQAIPRRKLMEVRERKLEVNFDPATARVLRLEDTPCPTSAITGSACQTVSGSFDLYVSDMSIEAQDELYYTYLNATQDAIDAGKLQEALESVDSMSSFVVEGAVDPPLSNRSPLGAQQQQRQQPAETDKNTISPIGVVFIIGLCGVILGVCIATFQSVRGKRENNRSKVAPLDANGSNKHSATEALTGHGEGDLLIYAPDSTPEDVYRSRVEALVNKNCPEQADNVDVLINQFKGREDKLILMLQNLGDDAEGDFDDANIACTVSNDDIESHVSPLSWPRSHLVIASQPIVMEDEEVEFVEDNMSSLLRNDATPLLETDNTLGLLAEDEDESSSYLPVEGGTFLLPTNENDSAIRDKGLGSESRTNDVTAEETDDGSAREEDSDLLQDDITTIEGSVNNNTATNAEPSQHQHPSDPTEPLVDDNVRGIDPLPVNSTTSGTPEEEVRDSHESYSMTETFDEHDTAIEPEDHLSQQPEHLAGAEDTTVDEGERSSVLQPNTTGNINNNLIRTEAGEITVASNRSDDDCSDSDNDGGCMDTLSALSEDDHQKAPSR